MRNDELHITRKNTGEFLKDTLYDLKPACQKHCISRQTLIFVFDNSICQTFSISNKTKKRAPIYSGLVSLESIAKC